MPQGPKPSKFCKLPTCFKCPAIPRPLARKVTTIRQVQIMQGIELRRARHFTSSQTSQCDLCNLTVGSGFSRFRSRLALQVKISNFDSGYPNCGHIRLLAHPAPCTCILSSSFCTFSMFMLKCSKFQVLHWKTVPALIFMVRTSSA